MKCFVLICLAAFALVGFADSSPLNIHRFQTASGMWVLFVQEKGLPIVDVDLAFAAGSSRDGKTPGLASLTSACFTQGAGDWNADKIADLLDEHGGVVGKSVNRDMSVITLRSLTDQADLVGNLKTYLTVVSKLNISQQTFNRLKDQRLSAIKMANFRPGYLASRALYQTLFAGTAYATPVMGSLSSVKALSWSEVSAFYQQYYVAKNALLVIVGNVDVAKAQSIANQVDQTLPYGSKASAINIQPTALTTHRIHIPFPSEQATILMGAVATAKNDPRNLALRLANVMLGGQSALSVLYQEVREQNGLAYSIHSVVSTMARSGVFYIGTKTAAKRSSDTLFLINEITSQFAGKPYSAENFANAKSYLLGHFPLSMDSNANIAGLLLTLGFYHLPNNYLQTYLHKLRALKAKQVATTFNSTIDLNKLLVVTVGGDE